MLKTKHRKPFSRLLAVMMSLAMVLALIPATAMAEGDDNDGGSTTTSSGIELSKTATLENNGTYTINLEAYATGTVTSTTTTTPTDVVLVLDVSGSMDFCIQCGEKRCNHYTYVEVSNVNTKGRYYYKTDSGTYERVYYCNSCKSWYTQQHYYQTHSSGTQLTPKTVDNPTGIAFYTYTRETRLDALKKAAETFINITKEKNNVITDKSDKHRISIVTFAGSGSTKKDLTIVDENGAAALNDTINSLSANGATNSADGMNLAKTQLDSYSKADRAKVVVLFTDGVPTTQNSFSNSVACSAINTAYSMKQNNTKIFTINVLDDADPSYADTSGSMETQKMNTYMNAVSSNYPNAKSGTNATSTSWSNLTLGDRESSDYYKKAKSTEELEAIFKAISDSVGGTTVTLDDKAVLKDIISDSFTLPDNFSVKDNVTIQTAKYAGKDDKGQLKWEDPSSEEGVGVYFDKKSVSITGFSYKDNYVIDGSSDGKVETSGKKLIVTITGIEALDSAVTGSEISTNDGKSGIYAGPGDEDPVAVFPQPKTILTSKTYVLDYAKTAELTSLDLDVKHLDVDDLSGFTAESPVTGIRDSYGKAELADGKLTYTPMTTNWDGYDSFYAFGTAEKDTIKGVSANESKGNLWSKISVIPANNVYYEDDFVTTSADGETTTPGRVGIVYDGEWAVAGSSAGNIETADNAIHGGWVDGDAGLSDDTGYSDGSAHVAEASSENLATATFTFTGTGVDIYSRTNNATGTIYVTVKNTVNGTTTTKRTVVDNKAKSGDYYQIPTYTFQGDYGTYDVTVRVTTGAASEGRMTYYLDGIRVYNPIQNEDTTVQEAYGAEEINAVFKEVRGLLDENSGSAFIDEDENGNPVEKNYTNSDVAELAPEHEVYLQKGQSIVFNVTGSDSNYYYLGLKAPSGMTSVAFSQADNAATTSVNHASDLYYKVIPSTDNKIVVTNKGENLLSITKLRITGSGESDISTFSEEEAVNAVMTFKAAKTVEYSIEASDEEELTEQPSETETEEIEETQPEETGEVVIDNPEEEQPEENISSMESLFRKLIGGFKNLFGHG